MKKKPIIFILSTLLGIIFFLIAFCGIVYYKINSPAFNIEQPVFIYIDNKTNYVNLIRQLEDSAQLKKSDLFTRLATLMKYPENVKIGKYQVTPKMSYLEAVRMFRSGQQVPVNITFNNIRFKKDFAERIGEQLMFDSDVLLEKLTDNSVCKSFGLDTTTILTLFIPNTYEMYWNISVDNFLARMKKEHDRFWTMERLAKAEAIRLTPVEVSILAAIVEEETAVRAEYPIVAGVYLNRLVRGMLLQADPTVKYAVGDVTLRRILFKHLEVDSPYNTYKYSGLPPGPIRMPSISGIDAVLNYQKHNYLYMCAKEDFSGTHNFAVTLSEHNRNAQNYQAALNRMNIR
jgi:UPF0755 protein